MSVHTGLIDNVNDAMTEWQHTYAEGVLRGWRAGLEHCGRAWSPCEADNHTMERFGEDRPMCCGVLLDWSPPADEDEAAAQRARDKCIGAYGYDVERIGRTAP